MNKRKISDLIWRYSLHNSAALSSAMTRVPFNAAMCLAILSFLVEIATLAIFAQKNVMLYADGGWFVFALATGNPWILKWRGIAARLTPYALTVWPVLKISQMFHLDPSQIGLVNCLQFYGLQIALTVWSYWLAWRTNPRLLVFPVTQTLLFSLLGWGFPSELLLGPGILWVILLTAVRKSGPNVLFLGGFAALVFTHELALPSALVAGAFALYLQWRSTGRNARFWVALVCMIATIAALFWVRTHGGGVGSDSNGIYVVDPRRVLANPLLVPLAVGAWLLRFPKRASWPALLTLSGLGFAGVMIIGFATSLNFDACRYGARSLIALGMLILAVLFVHAVLDMRATHVHSGCEATSQDRRSFGLAKYLFLSLGLQAGGIGVFVHDWILASEAETVVPANASARPQVIDISEARQSWTPAQRDASTRLQVEWSVPYRQFVLTNGRMPAIILYDKTRWYKEAGCLEPALVFGPESQFNAKQFTAWTDFTCAQPKPRKVNTLKDKVMQNFGTFLGRL